MASKRHAPLQPKVGFEWARVVWGGPHERQSDTCSYCQTEIAEEETPLRLWNNEGWAAVFCRGCMNTWWGIESFDDEDEQ